MYHLIKLASVPSEFVFVSGHFNLLLRLSASSSPLLLGLHFISFTCHDGWSLHVQREAFFVIRETEASDTHFITELHGTFLMALYHQLHVTSISSQEIC